MKLGEGFNTKGMLRAADPLAAWQPGMVIATEELQPVRDTNLSEGDMVMFSRFAGTDFRVDEEDFRILEENEIMCTLEDTEGVVVPVKEN